MVNSEFDNQNNDNLLSITDIIPLDVHGATSNVYKVRLNGKWHILKRPKNEYVSHPLYLYAFEKEFEIGYTLEHPNIVRYVSKGYDNDGIFLLTEYIDGITLKDFLLLNPNYFRNNRNSKKFLIQLLSTLEYLHSRQILHLDLKPENILITHINRDVKLIDFGFAYNDCYQFQSSGRTKEYAAPEQIGNGKINEQTDIYSLGLLVLYIYTGKTDFNDLNRLPSKYKTIAKKCLKESPTQRFRNVIEIKELLARKQNYVIILSIPFVVLLISTYLMITRNPTDNLFIDNKHIEDSAVSLLQKDTLNSIINNQDSVRNQTIKSSPLLKVSNLSEKERISNFVSEKIKLLFTPLYSTYIEINDENFSNAQQIYGNAVNASLGLTESITSDSSISSKEISYIIRKELDKETAHYISLVTTYMTVKERKRAEKRDRDFILYQNRLGEIFAPIDSLLQTKPEDGRIFMLQYKEIYRKCLKTIETDSFCNEHFKSSLNPFSTYTRELLGNYQNSAHRIYNANMP